MLPLGKDRFYNAPYFFALLIFFGLPVALFDARCLAESPPADSFPPEAQYPDEANEPEDEDQSESRKEDFLRPKDIRDSRPVERPKKKERRSTRSEGPSNWSSLLEGVIGWNQSTSSSDSNRSAVGLHDSLVFGIKGDLYFKWVGLEADARYSFTPIQQVILQDPTSGAQTQQNRALSMYSALIGLAYRHPIQKFSLLARLGYASLGVKENVESASSATVYTASVASPYIGLGILAQWNPIFSSLINYYLGVGSSGSLSPAASGTSGYGFWRLELATRARFGAWGKPELPSGFGMGINVTIQSMTTPTPPSGSLTGGAEKLLQFSGTAFVNF